MYITTQWHDEKETILLVTYTLGWTVEENYSALMNVIQIISEREEPMIVILDYTNSGPTPSGILTMRLDPKKIVMDKVLHVYVVGLNRYMEVILNVFKRILPIQLHKKLSLINPVQKALQEAQEQLAIT